VREKEQAFDYAAAATVAALLPVWDSLELSRKQEAGDADSLRSGLELITKQFSDALAKIGVEEIENEVFDPELHDAVMRDEESECENGKIVEVFQKGYRLKDRIVRHSMVKVKG
jgi:molecular chaperone GrpE